MIPVRPNLLRPGLAPRGIFQGVPSALPEPSDSISFRDRGTRMAAWGAKHFGHGGAATIEVPANNGFFLSDISSIRTRETLQLPHELETTLSEQLKGLGADATFTKIASGLLEVLVDQGLSIHANRSNILDASFKAENSGHGFFLSNGEGIGDIGMMELMQAVEDKFELHKGIFPNQYADLGSPRQLIEYIIQAKKSEESPPTIPIKSYAI